MAMVRRLGNRRVTTASRTSGTAMRRARTSAALRNRRERVGSMPAAFKISGASSTLGPVIVMARMEKPAALAARSSGEP